MLFYYNGSNNEILLKIKTHYQLLRYFGFRILDFVLTSTQVIIVLFSFFPIQKYNICIKDEF